MTDLEKLFEEHNRLLREQNALLREQGARQPSSPRKWTCGAWPFCHHGALAGGIFGCGDTR